MSNHRRTRSARFLKSPLALCLAMWPQANAETVFPQDATAWPAVTATNKPWTRWWWLGSGVDKANLTRELEAFAKAGIGGVEICPIYGAMGAEDRFIDFLSPKWMEMLAHTTTEAERLGMKVDLTTGTGWPFGGPGVKDDTASCGMQRISAKAEGGKPVAIKLPEGKLQCLMAFPESGPAVDLSTMAKGRQLDWTPPAGQWTIAGIASKSGIQKVKRAAPGGEGFVLDPFSTASIHTYTATFDKAFKDFKAPPPRAQFHDSFEYYGADWTADFLTEFNQRRGYDLRGQLPAFNGAGDKETVARVRADYRATLGELHRDYLKAWHDWAKQHGGSTRNQAHGSPGNLLDHYAVSEIPETEIFRHVGEDQIPMLRFAASAAHSNGGTLVSSESFTWLGEHFQVTPEKLREAADFVFLGGVNHLFFHGIPYSPEDAKWPGWLFYASTHMGPNGGLWRDLSAFNGYLQRCQSILQQGNPSSEVLLYFPYQDLLHDGPEKLPLFTIHNQNTWLHPTSFYQNAMELWNHGITFDFASDDMLARASVRDGKIILGNNSFKALVLPGAKHLDVGTLEKILKLASQGGTVIVQGGWPEDVPGFHQHAERRAALVAMEKTIIGSGAVPHGRGLVVLESKSILPGLAARGTLREPMTASGLRFVRRIHADGYHYFIVNHGSKPIHGIIPLAVPFKSVAYLDPWNPSQPTVVFDPASGTLPPGSHGIPIQLAAGQSIIVRTFTDKVAEGVAWAPSRMVGKAANAEATEAPPISGQRTVPLDGPWKLEFIDGGPLLPNAAEMKTLALWTTLPDPAVANFSGTARYTTTFDFNGKAGAKVHLDLGKVAHTARVSLNGKPVGISWCEPRRLDVSAALQPGRNTLAIEVTNLAANRIADLDRRKAPWKRFHEINFVNIDYQPFDASAWPVMESGLAGPVRLVVEK